MNVLNIKFLLDRGGANALNAKSNNEDAAPEQIVHVIPSVIYSDHETTRENSPKSSIDCKAGDANCVSVQIEDEHGRVSSSNPDLVDLMIEPCLEIMLNPVNEIYIQRDPGGDGGRYTLMDGSGQSVLTALMYHEDECLGQYRSFVMSVARFTNYPNNDDAGGGGEPIQVFDIRRKRACESVALRAVSASTYGNNISMNWSNGKLLGQIFQLRHCYRPTFEAETASGKKVFRIRGGWGAAACNPLWTCNNSQFKIYSSTAMKQEAIGFIKKGVKPPPEYIKEPNNVLFGASFPKELDPLTKILIIGALFHMNISYFERKFSPMDACILFRYFIVIALIAALAVAGQMGILEKIFSNKSDPEPSQRFMNKMIEPAG